MRNNWRLHTLVLGSLLVIPAAATPARAGHHDVLAPTSYVLAPTNYVEVQPTSYVVPTNYIVPTVYTGTSAYIPTTYVPTVYAPTTYVSTSYVPTTYVPTSYVSTSYVPTSYLSTSYAYVRPRGLFRRPRTYVERAVYTPTTYVLPTAYYVPSVYTPTTYSPTTEVYRTALEAPLVACAPDPCEVADRVPSIRYGGSSPARATARPGGAATESAVTPKSLTSEPVDEAGTFTPPESAARKKTQIRETPPPPAPATPIDSGVPEPPKKPAPEKDITSAPANAPAPAATPITPAPEPAKGAGAPGATKPTPPVAPDGEPPIVPAPEETTLRRDARKPVPPQPGSARTARRGNQTVLEGRVVSTETGEPEAGVQVTISNPTQAFADRVTVTDAYGRYAVRLPDGDWTVKVTMPSGRSYAVSELTVSQGQITDDLGRNIPSLTINR